MQKVITINLNGNAVLVPYAKTSEELAAAQSGNAGVPYRVQKVVEAFRRKVTGKSGKRKTAQL